MSKTTIPVFFLAMWAFSSCGSRTPQDPSGKMDMKEILHDLYINEDPDINYTRNDLYVARLEEEFADGNDDIKFELGVQLLVAGREDEALKKLKEFIEVNMGTDSIIKAPEVAEIIHWYALAHFRKGEVENCRGNHNASSCIMPLNEAARHKFRDGSLEAFRLYGKLLEYNPDDVLARWMLNLSAMTLGIYPFKVPAPWYMDFDKFRDTAATFPVFTDVAQNLGITEQGYFGGVIVEDFNNDGLLDLFDTDGPLNRDVRLWLRQPNGTFRNTTKEAGLTGLTGGTNAIQTDFNNDGWADIHIVRGGWLSAGGNQPASLLRNNGDGTFTDVTIQAGLLQYSPSHSSIWTDLDNDGWLDLIVGYETGEFEQLDDPNWKGKIAQHPTKVYRNNGNETFTDVTKGSGLELAKWVKGVVALDYDQDGKQDVYLSVFDSDNYLFKNTSQPGKISFVDVTAKAGVQYPRYSFPVVSADFNNDGWPDIFVAGYHTEQNEVPREYASNIPPLFPCYTYINQKDGTFASDSFGVLPQSIMAMALNAADLDNDGYLDIYLGTGAGMLTSLFPNIMLKNVEGKRWADVTTTARLGHLQKAHGIAMADLDRDGDLDIYLELGGLLYGDYFWNALYKNNLTETGKWINLVLQGKNSNRPAIGATIVVTYTQGGNTKSITRVVNSGGSYGASPWEQHIALGNADGLVGVKVLWPSGEQTEATNLAFNQYYQWTEDSSGPSIRKVVVLPFENPSTTGGGHHHHHH